jgi:hypothetical protein
MAQYSLNNTTTTDVHSQSYVTASQSLDYNEADDEIYIYFPNATRNIGYYKKYGQLKKAIDTFVTYIVGKGYNCEVETKVILDHLSGIGNDSSHEILFNLEVMSMVCGDSFAEIIESEKGTLLNLKPISPERMRVVIDGKSGIIKGYDVLTTRGNKNNGFRRLDKNKVLHIVNDRVGDEQHGTSVVDACTWVIDALEEARRDYRIVLHRNVVPLRIIEVDTQNQTEMNSLKSQYKTAISSGEVLIVPKGTVSISNDKIVIQDPIAWIQSLENYFYLAVGIPRVIASPDGLSEGSSKVGYLVFEPLYTYKQHLLETDLWNQVGIILTFNRPASLSDNIQSNEEKNTSQTGFQPKDMSVGMERE